VTDQYQLQYGVFTYLFMHFVEWGIEFRASYMLAKCSTTEKTFEDFQMIIFQNHLLFFHFLSHYTCVSASLVVFSLDLPNFFFLWDWYLNSGLCVYKVEVLTSWDIRPAHLFLLFWKWRLVNYLPRLPSNCNPPDLSLPSS
jgi:hypothetical protein